MASPLDPDEFFTYVLDYTDPDHIEPQVRGPAGRWQRWWRERWLDCGADAYGRLARAQGFVLSTADAARLGRPRHLVRSDVRRGLWTVAARGVVAPVTLPTSKDQLLTQRRAHALTATASALVRPGHVVGSRSAAVLHGLPTMTVPTLPELTTIDSTCTTGRRDRVHVRSASLAPAQVTDWYGTPVTTVARTIVDLARHDRVDGLLAADAALHERLVTRAELGAAMAAVRGWPGARRARWVISFACGLAESPLESLVRLVLHDDGFPPSQLQVEIDRYRVDFLWSEQRLVLEADGRGKYSDDEAWRQRRREAQLRRLGYRVERVIWADVTRYWPQTRARLREALLLPPDVVNHRPQN